jgi:hypothetical protein
MKDSEIISRLLVFFLCIFIFISGCNKSIETQTTEVVLFPSYVPSLSPLPPTLTESIYNKPSQTPRLQSTQTPIPNLTNTQTITPTWTSLPTLTHDEAIALAVELLTTNAGCQLPCWWGFTPGITSWSEAKVILEQLDPEIYIPFTSNDPIFFADVRIPVPSDISNTDLKQMYYVENEVITRISTIPGSVDLYQLSSFLGTYGPPKEVWISTYSTEYPVGILPFLVVLFYPDRGIFAIYGPESTSFVDGNILGCQMNGTPSRLVLWSPTRKMSFIEAAREFRMNPDEPGFLILPIEEATAMDVDIFYETYRIPNSDTCIETPRELWPEQQ